MTKKIHWNEVALNLLLGVMILCCIVQYMIIALILTGLWQPHSS